MARHGPDIGELLEHLGLSDVTLVGASMGGNAIWAHIDQFGTDRVRAKSSTRRRRC
jgi:non-heme chloroperoxidase